MPLYEHKTANEWVAITNKLVKENPITDCIVDLSLRTWKSILNGNVNSYLNLKISELDLSPQAVSNLFHDILPIYIERNVPNWKKGTQAHEKDVVYMIDDKYSFEVKVSSSKNAIFGNRSYGQSSGDSKKSKDGYYLAVNIDKLSVDNPNIRLIRFGWLNHTDWISQKAQTGQRSRLGKGVMDLKFKILYKYKNET